MKIPSQLKDLHFCRVKNKSKSPFEKDWVNQTYFYSTITNFVGENYGVVCGHKNLAVIDCDKEGVALAVESFLPKTFSVKTGSGGKHFYYFIPELKNKVILKSGEEHLGEIQSYGSQVVGAGSIHPNGKTYEVVDDVGISTISLKELTNVLGEFMIKKMSFPIGEGNVEEFKDLILEISKKWNEGNRQQIALSTAGYLRKEKRLGINKVKEIIREVCRICDDEELEMRLRAVEETFKKDEKEIKGITGLKEAKIKMSIREEVLTKLALRKTRAASELIVQYIEEKNFIYTIMEDDSSEVWFYNEGVYTPNGKSFIASICREILQENFTAQFSNEVIKKIEADTFINKEDFFQNKYLDEVPIQNGLLNIRTKELNPFDPAKIFFNKLPLKFDPSKKCPNIKEHFKTVLKSAEDSKVMFEVFGFFLYKDYFVEKAMMFLGDGRNGKGKTIDLMKRFLGADNCASVPLGAMHESSFRTWDLFGKMSNLAGDLSSTALKDTSLLKQTTGRDLIGADRKRKSTVNFVNYAKHVFACNDLPKVYDFSRGFWSRWVLFEFPYTFVKEELFKKMGGKEKEKFRIMNPLIMDNLSTPEELSGLLNEALIGLGRLFKEKDFSKSQGVEEVKRLWIRKSDSFTAFAMDHLEESVEKDITKAQIRKSFSKFCKEHKVRGASDINIKIVLEEMFGVSEKQEYESKLRVWEGIKFKEESKYRFGGGKLKE